MNKSLSVKNLVLVSVIAAIYFVPVFLFSDISFGNVQFRISEFLTVLPLFTFWAIPGLTLGCFLFNLIGFFLGRTVIIDLLFGTLATFIATIICYFLVRKIKSKILKCLVCPIPVILCNGIIVGYEITKFLVGGNFFINMALVALGECVVCYVLGLPLELALFKNDLYKKIF